MFQRTLRPILVAVAYALVSATAYVALTVALVSVGDRLTQSDTRLHNPNYEFLTFWQGVGILTILFALPVIGGTFLYAMMRLSKVGITRVILESLPLPLVYLGALFGRYAVVFAGGPPGSQSPAILIAGAMVVCAVILSALSAVFGSLFTRWKPIRERHPAPGLPWWAAVVIAWVATALAAGGAWQALLYWDSSVITSPATANAVLAAAFFFPGAIMLAVAVWLGRWSAGTWQATGTPTVARRLGAVASVAGSAIAIIGYLQPWWLSMDTYISAPCSTEARVPSSCLAHTGADLAWLGGIAPLGWLLFALLLLMLLVTLPSLWQPTRTRALWTAGLVVVALSIIGYALSLIVTISPTLYGPLALQMSLVSLDAGLWLTLGGLLGVLAGAGAIALSPRAEPQPSA